MSLVGVVSRRVASRVGTRHSGSRGSPSQRERSHHLGSYARALIPSSHSFTLSLGTHVLQLSFTCGVMGSGSIICPTPRLSCLREVVGINAYAQCLPCTDLPNTTPTHHDTDAMPCGPSTPRQVGFAVILQMVCPTETRVTKSNCAIPGTSSTSLNLLAAKTRNSPAADRIILRPFPSTKRAVLFEPLSPLPQMTGPSPKLNNMQNEHHERS